MSLQIDFQSGAKEVLDRVLQAYGFSTKLALAEHLGIASSSLANRYSRGYFPSDIVVRCMADTGATLHWLVTGQGETLSGAGAEESQKVNTTLLPRQRLEAGKLSELTAVMLDEDFLAFSATALVKPLIVVEGQRQWIAEQAWAEILDGEWLVSMEGQVTVRHLTRIPPGRVRVSSAQQQFECALGDITPLARLVIACQPL
ncbi:phage repressor protein CI [Erwinia aphidicola]|nr:phage repressor protein CI [Erwinia aphidicola]